MLQVCAARFNVTKNFKNFLDFGRTQQAVAGGLAGWAVSGRQHVRGGHWLPCPRTNARTELNMTSLASDPSIHLDPDPSRPAATN